MTEIPPLPDNLEIPAEWQALVDRPVQGLLMVVGAPDSGKSTLVHWLLNRLCRRGQRPAWIDGDLGQSNLGLPGTLNVALAGSSPSSQAQDRAFFVGSTSPSGHMLPVLAGLRRLVEHAVEQGADPVLVDTSGMIHSRGGGVALKEWQAELLRPDRILALQRDQELEHLLGPWRHETRFRLNLLPVAAGVRQRSAAERAEYRRRRLREALAEAAPVSIQKSQTPIYGLAAAGEGRLAGLLDRHGFLQSVGVVRQVDTDGLELLANRSDTGDVAAVRIGPLRIDPETGAERT